MRSGAREGEREREKVSENKGGGSSKSSKVPWLPFSQASEEEEKASVTDRQTDKGKTLRRSYTGTHTLPATPIAH